MKLTGGAIVVRALEDEGIDLAFGIPGTHNIELYDYELEHFAAAMHVPYLRLSDDDTVEATLREADQIARSGQPVLVEVDIDYARKTFFTKGVVKANLHRLPVGDRVRFIGRAVKRKFTG